MYQEDLGFSIVSFVSRLYNHRSFSLSDIMQGILCKWAQSERQITSIIQISSRAQFARDGNQLQTERESLLCYFADFCQH